MKKSTRKQKNPARQSAKPGNSGNGPGHNSQQARAGLIVEVCRKITALQDQRAAINAEMSSIKNTDIKGTLGMKVNDFGNALRLYQLEGDDRDQFLDTTRELFDALGVGEQLDWITATQRVSKAATEPVDEAAEAAAVADGPV